MYHVHSIGWDRRAGDDEMAELLNYEASQGYELDRIVPVDQAYFIVITKQKIIMQGA